MRRQRINRFHAVVNEDKPGRRVRAPFRIARLHQLFLKRRDHCLNRQPVAWRRFDHDMSRSPTSDMCSVRGIGVAESASTSTFLRISFRRSLCATPKRCSSSTISKPEIVKLHVFRKQPVRADHHVHFARFQIRQNLFLLRRAAKAAEHFNARRESRESLLERFVMLKRQHRRRRQHRHLLAVRHGLERRAHGHFRLAVAHVAAKQPVHRLGALHIALDVRDGRVLVGRLLEFERVLKFPLPIAVRRKMQSPRRFCAPRKARAACRPCPPPICSTRVLRVVQAVPPSLSSGGCAPSSTR